MKTIILVPISAMLIAAFIVKPKTEVLSQSLPDAISKIDTQKDTIDNQLKRVDEKTDIVFNKVVRNQKKAEEISNRKPRMIFKRIYVEKRVPVVVERDVYNKGISTRPTNTHHFERYTINCDSNCMITTKKKIGIFRRIGSIFKTKHHEVSISAKD